MTQPRDNPARRLVRCGLLCAIALTIFLVEAQFPAPIPLPGIKLGLSNIVTVCAMFLFGPGDALLILLGRIFLGSVFSGQMMTLLYSLCGGMLSYLSLLALRRVAGMKFLWLASALAGICHNVGQLLAAAVVVKSWVVLAYLPYLILAGAAAGLFTGICAQLLLQRLKKQK